MRLARAAARTGRAHGTVGHHPGAPATVAAFGLTAERNRGLLNLTTMASPYAPYASIHALLEAADVPAADFMRYTTPQLLEMAAARREPARDALLPPARGRGRPPLVDGPVYVIRSVRLLVDVQRAVDKRARKAGSNLNQVVCMLLQEWLDG